MIAYTYMLARNSMWILDFIKIKFVIHYLSLYDVLSKTVNVRKNPDVLSILVNVRNTNVLSTTLMSETLMYYQQQSMSEKLQRKVTAV